MAKYSIKLWLTFLFLLPIYLSVQGAPYRQEDLVRDLLIVDDLNKRLNERLPVNYNHLYQGGYWAMPSARMGSEGEVGLSYVEAHPYRLWNLRCQLTDRLEISGNYRIFKGIKDPVLSAYGFGDFSDKGVNFKWAMFHPEDSYYQLPGLAIGFEDIIGTRAFKARYLVLTQVFLNCHLEVSLGYGQQRIRGWFGGFNWMPFRRSCYPYLENFTLCAEYDATGYRHKHIEPHPKGREQRTHWNAGFKYRLWEQFDCSLSYMRGKEWAFSLATYYNFGNSEGLIPKTESPLPYIAPVNLEPLNDLRNENVLVADLVYAFRKQGLNVLQVWLSTNESGEHELRLNISNQNYRTENDVRLHLNHLMAYLIPLNVSKVTIGIDCEGMIIQEYPYHALYTRDFGNKEMSGYELKILTPLSEASSPDPATDWLLFDNPRPPLCIDFLPKTYTYFGSSTGKFKYALGVQAVFNGYLPKNIFYSAVFGCIGFKNISDIKDMDRLNPSQLLNVRTDIIRYYQQGGITLDEAYLQKSWNLGRGCFSRVSLGYFEVEYGGVAAELLYYPVRSRWAFGVEAAVLGKRKVGSLFGFTGKIRKLEGFKPTYRKFIGSQYFFNIYYDWKEAKLDLRIKVGKFLAHDYGIRYELSRYFPSGLRITLWYTRTNGRDKINGQTYYDKGIYFTMPLDIFYNRCSQDHWSYGMSAWLRDVGVAGYTGQELYYLLNDQRD